MKQRQKLEEQFMDSQNKDVRTSVSLLALIEEESRKYYEEKICLNKKEDDMIVVWTYESTQAISI